LDKYRIDSHKLIYHVDRVNSWLKGEEIYPIYIEISLCGLCNHRCIFCAVDYLGYKPISLDAEPLNDFICEASLRGVKSIMFAGSGEPLLYKKFDKVIASSKKGGIDTAITTNGVMLTREKAERCLESLSWIKVSLNAGSRENYSRIHKANQKDFDTVFENLESAVKIRNNNKYDCAIGAQVLLLPQNAHEIVGLAVKLKNIGVDYLVIKPYSQHPLSINRLGECMDYTKFLYLDDKLAALASNDFDIIFRKNAMKKLDTERNYQKNYGLSFSAYLDETGDIYPCIEYSGKPEFVLGNIYRESFEEIWLGSHRKEVMEKINAQRDFIGSNRLTRMEEVNEYLWDLKHPPLHANFI